MENEAARSMARTGEIGGKITVRSATRLRRGLESDLEQGGEGRDRE